MHSPGLANTLPNAPGYPPAQGQPPPTAGPPQMPSQPTMTTSGPVHGVPQDMGGSASQVPPTQPNNPPTPQDQQAELISFD